MNLKIEYVNINDLKKYHKNAKKHPKEQVKRIANSIKEFGMCDPIGVWGEDNLIIEGHGRLMALKKLGYKEAPIIRLDHLSEEQRKAYTLAHNKSAESEWDFEILAEELNSIVDIDMMDFGFDLSIDEEEPKVIEDEVPEVPEEPKAKYGDIYQLGNHRLMCGDSTDINDVEKLMNGEKSHMVFTDPPYLMGFEGNVHGDGTKSHNAKFGAIKNDKMSREDGDKFILDTFNMIKNFNEGAYYVCFYRLGLDYIFRALDTLDNRYKALIIWNKGNHTLSNSDYMSKYEPIVYGWFNEHNFYGDRSNFDIWDIKRTKKNDLHPTMKPVELVEKAMLNSSKKGDIVLDLFGGSGTTLMVSEQLDRNARIMELDPRYVDTIINRWENMTGSKGVLLNG
jgi:site-specific DNA-methyltransferase (adenine-specific)